MKISQNFRLSVRFFVSALLSAALVMIFPALVQGAATPSDQHIFRVQERWNVGGEGGWGHLFFEAASHRLYIPRGNRVMVVDAMSGKAAGEIDGLVSARAVALDSTGKFGYITDLTDGTAGFVRVFDRSSLKIVSSVPAGINPDVVLFEPVSKSVFAVNSVGRSITVIDSSTNQVSVTIPLASRPTSAVVDGNGMLFVSLPGSGSIVRIDAVSRKAVATWPLAPCTGAIGLAMNPAGRQLFTVCEDHRLLTVNVDTGHVAIVGEVPSDSGDIGFNPKGKMLFVADADGTLNIYRSDSLAKYSRFQQVKTVPGARTMTLSPEGDKAYLVTAKFGQNTAAVSEELQFRPTPVTGTFCIIVIGR
jgi:YVTN family beta-propeller protein